MIDTYIALDLELLDPTPRGQEILEIGAARFRGGQVEDELSLLVQTRGPLTARISALTGIVQEDLAGAVALPLALAALRRFIGGLPVVGQSVGLDLQQLDAAGLRLGTPALDTFELATLLLPGLPVYDLSTIAGALGVDHGEPRHRALPDARLAMRVFLALLERIERLDARVLTEVVRLSEPLEWPLRPLFQAAQRRKVRATSAFDLAASYRDDGAGLLGPAAHAPAQREPLRPSDSRRRVNVDKLVRSLSTGGSVASSLAGYEQRDEQLSMLRAVAGSLNEGGQLLVEAGTGTGKSLAYLLPAAEFAVLNDRRVVVSTNTINLQDQLRDKDLPTVQATSGRAFRFAVLKGRTNYLCLRRWLTLLRADDPSPDERRLLIRTLLWLPATRSGDRAELRLTRGEAEAWSRVSAIDEVCTPTRCAFHRAGTCFLARARRAAESSHVVIVNHALLLSDVAASSMVLPEYRHLIIDEAHHLEDEATSQLGWSLSQRELLGTFDRVFETAPSATGSVAARALDLLRRQRKAPPGLPERLSSVGAALSPAMRAAREQTRRLFGLLGAFAVEHGSRGEGGPATLRLTDSARAQPDWSEIETAWQALREALDALYGHLTTLRDLLEVVERRDETWDELVGELALQASNLATAAARLNSAISQPDRTMITWLALNRAQEVEVSAAPLDVSGLLKGALFDEKETVVLTSATLATAGSLTYLRERLGLDSPTELIVGSPFDFTASTLLYLPTDLPEPNQAGYQAAVERAIGSAIAALEGRTLALFTSHNQLRTTYQALKEALAQRGITVLGQGLESASRERLVQQFRSSERVALMGTSSFWEGVDVVGPALSCLAIARLPFTAPSDPIFQARSEQFADPFGQYAVPQAVLRLRQGFGRLIRRRDDRGIVLVLDTRIWRRGYGQTFLQSLPPCTVVRGPVSKIPTVAREWLSREVALS